MKRDTKREVIKKKKECGEREKEKEVWGRKEKIIQYTNYAVSLKAT